ncbi:MAG: 2-oxo acid dehydrogenase subunit E2 [Trueperaceae bacterium]|nr:MAG: 2-oxo acid dehydrogenase subunit E2 [Trueperaceae bacterium]
MATEFRLPEVGEGIEVGTVVGILVSVGDKISVDQPVLELETDKAVIEVPSSVGGVIQSIDVDENDEVSIGQVILRVGDASHEVVGETTEPDAETPSAPTEKEVIEPSTPLPPTPTSEAPDVPVPVPSAERTLVPAAPSVRRLARELGVDIHEVVGSGILGRISIQDVVAYAEGGVPSPVGSRAIPTTLLAPPLPDFEKYGDVERRPMSGIRKATVRAMTTAWATVPMVTHFDKADITEFEALRKRYQPKAEQLSVKLTPTAMIVNVVAAALRKFPDFNSSIDVEKNEIVAKRYVNVGVAVDTDHGLLVPVIKHADRRSVIDLARELGELAERARARKLSPEDMQGGNFSVSNLGGIGGSGFTPIVNPPDVAILGVARASYEPVYNRGTAEFEARLMMPLALSYDHRLIDGASAARFLRWICNAIEDPFLLMLEG